MKLIYLAALALAIFVAVWIFIVVPAEKRYHERKLAALQKQIAKREDRVDEQKYSAPPNENDPGTRR